LGITGRNKMGTYELVSKSTSTKEIIQAVKSEAKEAGMTSDRSIDSYSIGYLAGIIALKNDGRN